MKYAILIDAGFVKRKLASFEKPLVCEQVSELIEGVKQHPKFSSMYLYRVYFYDAPPLQKTLSAPLKKGKVALSDTLLAKSNQQLHKHLSRLDNVAMRMGELRFRGWRLNNNRIPKDSDTFQITAEDLQPDIKQKGVDMRIGLDIASLVLKKHVDIIVLVSGDSDFVPPIKFARREGVQIALILFDHDVNKNLITHSDFVVQLKMA